MTLTHFNAAGQAHMVDVSDKPETTRQAIATGSIRMSAATLEQIRQGRARKGDVLGVARIAAIGAAKRAAEWIPLCHPLMLSAVDVDFVLDADSLCVHCEVLVRSQGRTGVEMEALAAVAAGLLTIYDMVKAIERGMCITDIRLLEKSGGRSGLWRAPAS